MIEDVNPKTYVGREAILNCMLGLMGEGSLNQHQLDLGMMLDTFDDGEREPKLTVSEDEHGSVVLELEVSRYKITSF